MWVYHQRYIRMELPYNNYQRDALNSVHHVGNYCMVNSWCTVRETLSMELHLYESSWVFTSEKPKMKGMSYTRCVLKCVI